MMSFKSVVFFILTVVFLLLQACQNPSTEKNPLVEKALQKVFSEPITLWGLHATSTMMPHKENAIEHVFSENDKRWTSMKGAGPGEGFGFNFDEKTYVKTIEIKQSKEAEFAQIKQIRIFINGAFEGLTFNTNEAIVLDQELSSIYFQVDSTSHLSYLPKGENKNIKGIVFDSTKRLGIDYLEFKGKEDKSLNLLAPRRVVGKAIASSTLEPASDYSVANIFDGQIETVWCEGEKGLGIGETINLIFEVPVRVTALKLWNGNQSSEESFKANARIGKYVFGTEKIYPNHCNLESIQGGQTCKLMTSHMGEVFGFRIKSAVKGESRADSGISEMLFYDGYEPFVMETGIKEGLKRKRIEAVQGTPMESLLDKNVMNQLKVGPAFKQVSLVLRSEGTFCYKENEAESKGTWEVTGTNQKGMKVKLLGRTFAKLKTNKFEELLSIYENKAVGSKKIRLLVW